MSYDYKRYLLLIGLFFCLGAEKKSQVYFDKLFKNMPIQEQTEYIRLNENNITPVDIMRDIIDNMGLERLGMTATDMYYINISHILGNKKKICKDFFTDKIKKSTIKYRVPSSELSSIRDGKIKAFARRYIDTILVHEKMHGHFKKLAFAAIEMWLKKQPNCFHAMDAVKAMTQVQNNLSLVSVGGVDAQGKMLKDGLFHQDINYNVIGKQHPAYPMNIETYEHVYEKPYYNSIEYYLRGVHDIQKTKTTRKKQLRALQNKIRRSVLCHHKDPVVLKSLSHHRLDMKGCEAALNYIIRHQVEQNNAFFKDIVWSSYSLQSFSANTIRSVAARKNIEYLIIKNSPKLLSIDKYAFKDYKQLILLNMSDNGFKVKNLSQYTFGQLKTLTALDFSGNFLGPVFNEAIFSAGVQHISGNLGAMKTLLLHGSNIKSIDVRKLIHHMPHLTLITLTGNTLDPRSYKIIDELSKLRSDIVINY